MSRSLKTYDHRLRDLVRRTRDLTIATRAGVPRSTAAGWLLSPNRPTVSLDVFSMTEQDLQTEVQRLRQRVEQLRVIARILFACFRALDIDLPRRRIPDGGLKSTLLLLAAVRIRGILAFVTEATPRHGPGNVGWLLRADQPGWRGHRLEGVGGTLMRYARSGRRDEDRLSGQPEEGTRATHVDLTGNQTQAW